jgi:hypothetical protein
VPITPTVLVITAVIALVVAGQWWVLFPAFFLLKGGGCAGHAWHHSHRAPRREERDETVYV